VVVAYPIRIRKVIGNTILKVLPVEIPLLDNIELRYVSARGTYCNSLYLQTYSLEEFRNI